MSKLKESRQGNERTWVRKELFARDSHPAEEVLEGKVFQHYFESMRFSLTIHRW